MGCIAGGAHLQGVRIAKQSVSPSAKRRKQGRGCMFSLQRPPIRGKSEGGSIRIRLRTFLSKFIGPLLNIHTREAFHPT